MSIVLKRVIVKVKKSYHLNLIMIYKRLEYRNHPMKDDLIQTRRMNSSWAHLNQMNKLQVL